LHRNRLSAEERARRERERARRYRASLTGEQKDQRREQARKRRVADPERHREYTRRDYQKHREERVKGSQRTAEKYREKYRARRSATAAVRRLRGIHGGMTPEDWAANIAAQEGRCCYCQRPLPEDRKQVHIDHDHSCTCGPRRTCVACRRGLACWSCNALIGNAGDDPDRLEIILVNFRRLKAQACERISGQPTQDELPLGVTPIRREAAG